MRPLGKNIELRKINYRSVCLGSYIPWDIKKQVSIIKKELGWKGDIVENVPDGYDYISTDYNLNRISRKLERKALITTSDNDKLIDEYTYQCSEKKISGDS